MKKVIVILTVLFMVGIFSACQKKAEQEAPKAQPETTVVDTAAADTVQAETPAPEPEK